MDLCLTSLAGDVKHKSTHRLGNRVTIFCNIDKYLKLGDVSQIRLSNGYVMHIIFIYIYIDKKS